MRCAATAISEFVPSLPVTANRYQACVNRALRSSEGSVPSPTRAIAPSFRAAARFGLPGSFSMTTTSMSRARNLATISGPSRPRPQTITCHRTNFSLKYWETLQHQGLDERVQRDQRDGRGQPPGDPQLPVPRLDFLPALVGKELAGPVRNVHEEVDVIATECSGRNPSTRERWR